METSEIYTYTVWSQLRPYYANWQPAASVSIGQYGLLENRRFVSMGHVNEFGVAVETETHPGTQHYSFLSSKEGKLNFAVRGKVAAKASLRLSFGAERCVFFNASDCRFSTLKSKQKTGARIKELKDWDDRWVVVSDLVSSTDLTVAISSGRSGQLVLEAQADIDEIDLANGQLSLKPSVQENVGYLVYGTHASPLFGLCRLRRRYLVGPEDFRPLAAGHRHDPADESVDFYQVF